MRIKKGLAGLAFITITAGLAVTGAAMPAEEQSLGVFTDPTFKQYISNNFDKDKNGKLSTSEISEIKKISLGLDHTAIENLKGIEKLTDVREINIYGLGNLTELNVSYMDKLETLTLKTTGIKTLNIAGCTSLQELNCEDDKIEKLSLYANEVPSLKDIRMNKENLKSVYINNAVSLEKVYLFNCPDISSISITSCPKLTTISNTSSDKLYAVEVNNNPKLSSLNLFGVDNHGSMVYKDLPKLQIFDIAKTAMKSIPLEYMPDLRDLNAYEADLSGTIDLRNMPNLKYAQVDTNPAITDVKLGDKPSLLTLDVSKTAVSSIDIGKCTALKTLRADETYITELRSDITTLGEVYVNKCPDLKTVYLNGTGLLSVFIQNNPSLELAEIYGKNVRSLYLTGSNIKKLSFYSQAVVSSDIYTVKTLETLSIESATLNKFDLSGLIKLKDLTLFEATVASGKLDLSGDSSLTTAKLTESIFKDIVLDGCDSLTSLMMLNTTVENIDISGLDKLQEFYIYSTNLTSLDLSNNPNLQSVNCQGLGLTELPLPDNGNISKLVCSGNAIGSLDLYKCRSLLDLTANVAPHEINSGKYTAYGTSSSSMYLEIDTGVKLNTVRPTPTPAPATATPTPTAVPGKPTATPTAVPGLPTPTTDPSAPTATPTVATTTPEPTGTTPTVTPKPGTPSVTPIVKEPTVTPSENNDQIREFVNRIYTYVLDREPEEEGANFWTEQLHGFKLTGADVGLQFIFSDEFVNRNLSNEDFVTVLYKTFFGRDPEEGGFAFWTGALADGTLDRRAVAEGFIFSQEWADTCARYGIRSGGSIAPSVEIAPTDATFAFVERMYTTAMKRESDEEGAKFWANELSNFRFTGEQVGVMFFLSEEMQNFNLDNNEFVTRLYKTFMDRDPEEGGFNFWVGYLNDGGSREGAVLGFTRSEEFVNKCIEARILPY